MAKIFDLKKTYGALRQPGEEMWGELRQALREQFPNPRREGCPAPAVLMQLAQRRMPLEEAEPWLDHFSRCSPCFRDFEQLQLQAKQLRQLRWKTVAGVAVGVGLSLALWFTYSHEKAIRAKTMPSGVPTVVIQAYAEIALHFETELSPRDSGRPNPNPPQLPRSRVALSIYLAAGSQAGRYEIELLRNRSDSVPQARFEGTTQIEGDAMVLRSMPDLSAIEPGIYLVALRSKLGRWRYFPVTIS